MLLGESVFNTLNQVGQPTMQVPATTIPIDQSKLYNDAGILNVSLDDINSEIYNETSTISPMEIDNAVFESVFNSNGPLIDGSVDLSNENDFNFIFNSNNDEIIKSEEDLEDELLKLMNPTDLSSSFIESRSMSAPISINNNKSLNQKRSFSSLDLSNEESKKKDKLGCTSYTRKQRSAPLLPIVPVSNDDASVKRARNTEAARRSRARKMERMSQLETKCENLLKENDDLKSELKALRNLLSQKQ